MYVKRIIGGLVLCLLAGCGGGGGGGTAAPATPLGTQVDLTVVRSMFMGTGAVGSQTAYSLTGSDSLGGGWSSTLTMISDGPVLFENQNVTRSRTLITAQQGTRTPVSDVQTSYYQVANGSFYKSSSTLSGAVLTPTSQAPFPATLRVGDSGALLSLTDGSGNSETVSYRVDPEFNGNAKFVLSYVNRNAASVVTSTEDDTFFVDPAGTPYRLEISTTANGLTVNLGGNKL